MKDLVLAFIYFYENTISTMEKMISLNYEPNRQELEKIKVSLKEVLAKNCFLRKKDFDTLMRGILVDVEKKEETINNQKARLVKKVAACLEEQKELTGLLKGRLEKFAFDGSDPAKIEELLNGMKGNYQEKVRQIIGELEVYEQEYKVYQREQAEVIHRLHELLEKGEGLRIEDLKKLKPSKDTGRAALRRERKEGVEKLLASFRQRRLANRRQWRR